MKQSTILEVDTRIVTDEGRPWLSLRPYADLVSIKLLSTDPVRGEIIVVLRAPPGIELPRRQRQAQGRRRAEADIARAGEAQRLQAQPHRHRPRHENQEQ